MSRIKWLDSAKALGIILVILGHVPSQYEYRWVIYLFHMPLFFMLSGYLFKFIEPRKECVRSMKALIVPYLMYSIVLYLLWTIQKRIFDPWLLVDILTSNQNSMGNKATSLCPLWFLVSLFTMRIVTSLIGKKNLKIAPPLLIVICLICSYLGQFQDVDRFKIGSTMLCYPFFILGIWLRSNNMIEKIVSSPQRGLALAATFLLTIGAIYEGYINGMVDCISSKYGTSIFTFYVVAVILSIAFMLLNRMLFNTELKVLKLLSEGTLLILSCHYVMISPLNALFGKYKFGFLLITAIILAICCIMIWISKKWFPLLIGKWK